MWHLKILLIIFINTYLSAQVLNINNQNNFYDLLPKSQIYVDNSQKKTFEEISNNPQYFNSNDKKLIGYGYSPSLNVWVKFKIHNNTNKKVYRVLEYDNTLTSNIRFYSPDNDYKYVQEGLFNINENRKTINPNFSIQLEANESKTYYIQASSYITTLIVKLNLWENDSYFKNEIKYQIILAFFFGAMIILALYNLFIYFITKDNSYLFYVIYIFGIVLHQLMYRGIANIYILDPEWVENIIRYASLITGLPVLALALFTRSFLRTQQYPKLHKLLNIYLLAFPFILTIFLFTDMFNKYRNVFSVLLLVFLISITIYATFKKNRQAYFVLFGWSMFFTVGMFMYLSSLGVFNIYSSFPYYIEVALIIEAIVFSIALADRIKQLEIDKENANKKLIIQQENEKNRLEIKVEEKTHDLKTALDEKGLLLKELNHRVKNNMQTIVSLIRLQSDEIEDEKVQDLFITIQNRINAMSHLHELLYKQDNIANVNAYEYFELLIEEVQYSYNTTVQIKFDIKTQLKIEQAIYCGLILNELISNSFKYAFPTNEGKVFITLEKKKNTFVLTVKDNGVGYDQSAPSNSLGLILVETLAKEQLKGDIDIKTDDGVTVIISWKENI